jgi:hypothetical protein
MTLTKKHNIHKILELYEFRDIIIEYQCDIDDELYPSSITAIKEEVISCKIPIRSLEKIASILEEWENLNKNPESARLIYEARFINRLKQGL